LRRNNIEVDFHPQHDLPGVIGDANQLIQVFLNLITNAEQAIQEVRDAGRIQIRAGRNGKQLTITVQDDGVGSAPKRCAPFSILFTPPSAPAEAPASGLASACPSFAKHGGNIEAEILPAGGSAFTIYLPVVTVEGPETVSRSSGTGGYVLR